MQEMVEKKKCLIELKSKVRVFEEQRNKLIEYVKLLESIMCRSSQFGEIIPNICSELGFKLNM